MSGILAAVAVAGGGGGGATLATWNPADKAALVTLSGGDLTAQRTSGTTTYQGVRATKAITAPAYFEISVNWGASGVLGGIGVALPGLALATATAFPGSTADSSALWGANNTNYFNGVPTDYANAPVGTNTYGVAINPTTGNGWVRNNNLGATYFGGGDPAAGTLPTFTVPAGSGYFPILSLVSGFSGAVTANFGQTAFVGTPPAGFGNV